ncbi:cupin-like domain-containing protein [[Limnothrix rosea] IAM M-220]|uniref:cupin-like domain-containing protein n=1 Tax=[Limnothrix rosea] IAM M-220 TaxID=454133 RepID=UPI00095B16E3|nr:cupin-like domain-containing protein [[Limnothrix rosea] IAM M-220]OKH18198.1 hypothetical protein NIES208_06650 [[Limnothrix rosea] IAM M-220]
MAKDLKELQKNALDFLQQRLSDPETSAQEKVTIALGILGIKSSDDDDKTMSNAEGTISTPQAPATLPIPALYTLDESWQIWLVENKLRGVSDQSLVEILMGQGMTQETAHNIVFSLPQEVSFSYIQPRWRSLQQYELIAELYREKEQASPETLDVYGQLSKAVFEQNYLRVNRPVILKNLGGDRPWYTQTTLAQAFPEHPVISFDFPELSAPATATKTNATTITSLGDYLCTTEPQVYLNFDLIELGAEAIADCYQAYPLLLHYLNCDEPDSNQAFLWLQPTFSPFPLQAKLEDLLMVQVWGESHWSLAAPWQSEFLYSNDNWTSPIDLANYNKQRYPRCAEAKFYELTLTAGQALFVPALWWQQCRAITNSAQLCFRNLS